jgi:Protein of unknown function (DUF2939)
MKRTLIVSLIAVLGIGYFLAAPFIGLAHLRAAIEARNAAALSERVDFSRLRRSLGEQIVATYLKITGKGGKLGRLGTSIASHAAASLADPLLADLVNPETVLDLLSGRGVATASLKLPSGLGPLPKDALGSLWRAFANSEYGLGNFYISLPADAAATDQFRLRLQVLQWDWKLTEIGMPERLRVELAKELERRIGAKARALDRRAGSRGELSPVHA